MPKITHILLLSSHISYYLIAWFATAIIEAKQPIYMSRNTDSIHQDNLGPLSRIKNRLVRPQAWTHSTRWGWTPPVGTQSCHWVGWYGRGKPSSRACSSDRCPSLPSGVRCLSFAAWEFQRSRFCGEEEQTQQIVSEVRKYAVNIVGRLSG